MRKMLFIVIVAALVVGLTACNEVKTSSDMCAIIVGNGNKDRKIKNVVYPGQKASKDDQNENARYFPCNSRNYVVNDGTTKDANGHKVGDRLSSSKGYTKQHTPILVSWTAYWTLNQDKTVLKNSFAPLCLKYKCASEESSSGDANFSTAGWNGMLGENFGPSGDQSVLEVTPLLDDSIWRTHDPAKYKELEQKMSEVFAANAQATTGYSDDLFCGSGSTSGWDDPSKPGEQGNKFKCGKVRFRVTDVQNANADQQDSAGVVNAKEQQEQANKDQLDIAKAKYGKNAGYWLAVQDALKACRTGATCVLNVGGNAVPLGK
jgi:hypothetical protein